MKKAWNWSVIADYSMLHGKFAIISPKSRIQVQAFHIWPSKTTDTLATLHHGHRSKLNFLPKKFLGSQAPMLIRSCFQAHMLATLIASPCLSRWDGIMSIFFLMYIIWRRACKYLHYIVDFLFYLSSSFFNFLYYLFLHCTLLKYRFNSFLFKVSNLGWNKKFMVSFPSQFFG